MWLLARASVLKSHTKWRIYFTCFLVEAWPCVYGSVPSTHKLFARHTKPTGKNKSPVCPGLSNLIMDVTLTHFVCVFSENIFFIKFFSLVFVISVQNRHIGSFLEVFESSPYFCRYSILSVFFFSPSVTSLSIYSTFYSITVSKIHPFHVFWHIMYFYKIKCYF